jgi:hypothetical protein
MLLEEVRREDGNRLRRAIKRGDTPALFDWLFSALSYQGVSNQVAYDYMKRHGRVSWHDLQAKFACRPACPKLRSYWRFYGCRYDKASRTCSEPCHVRRCPLPGHDLRNGRLNQTAYSLYLFIRGIADGDLIAWIDARLHQADDGSVDRLTAMRRALIEPLREIYGVSDKVLSMAFASILLAAPKAWALWTEVGGSMVVVDTLVHNFLHRTGILRRCDAEHTYGPICYRPGGCADIIMAVAQQIDARAFNPNFPRTFPRFVQHAIWRYCAQDGLDVCNGNRIDDTKTSNSIICSIVSNVKKHDC